jgi:gluconokinase
MNGSARPTTLAVDIGTSSARALLYDGRGQVIPGTEAQIPYDVTTTADGGVEVDAPMLADLVARCIDGALARAGGQAAAIGRVATSCFMHSLVGLDAAGAALTPVYMWGDIRAGEQVRQLRASTDGEAVRQRTGVVLHSSYWPAKLRWLRDTQPETFARVRRWASFDGYLHRAWLGRDVIALPMATSTGLLNVVAGGWDAPTMALAGIDAALLPEIVGSASTAALATAAWRSRWPALVDVPWHPAAGDGLCANVGSGAIDPGSVALTLGTSGAVRAVAPAPLGQPFVVPENLWAYRLDADRVVIGAAVSNGGNVTAWVADLLGANVAPATWDAAGEIAPDSHGLTFLPFLSGERAPIWSDDVTAAIVGLRLSTGPAHLLRGAMESVALRLALLYRALAPHAAPGHRVVANGGALLNSPAWQRIACDALGVPLTLLPKGEEASARGAALIALEASGALSSLAAAGDPAAGQPVLAPDPAAHATYLAASARQQAFEAALRCGPWWA